MYNTLALSILIMLYNHHHSVQKGFVILNRNLKQALKEILYFVCVVLISQQNSVESTEISHLPTYTPTYA